MASTPSHDLVAPQPEPASKPNSPDGQEYQGKDEGKEKEKLPRKVIPSPPATIPCRSCASRLCKKGREHFCVRQLGTARVKRCVECALQSHKCPRGPPPFPSIILNSY